MLRKVFFSAALVSLLSGCAGARPPIVTEAALGKVVVYRNGVAYFERRARVTDGELRLTVPVDRVDDFLKSLKVVDAGSGDSVPLSFKTMTPAAAETEMRITVPGKGPRDLLVSYVTDSPAWKPSYRLVLGKKNGKAEIEAWAVVDNVSGEDWKQVTVGVGSTSALSFKYDLHSVRMVERETLGDDPAVALAPPTGGSPYAVASNEVPVVAELGGSFVDRLLGVPARSDVRKSYREDSSGYGSSGRVRASRAGVAAGASSAALALHEEAAGPPGRDDRALDHLAEQLRKQPGKVKLQGFARAKDHDGNAEALKRANIVRDGLIARGVPADKLEATAANAVSEHQAVRLVAEPTAERPEQPKSAEGTKDDPIGSSYFVARTAMTIEKDRSAMVSLMKSEARAERVYFYDPISSRGSQAYAFQAVRLENPSDHTLDRGPFTVYTEGQFLGEGLSEAIPPRSTAFIPFALDRQVQVDTKSEGREEIARIVTIDRGIVTAEAHAVRKTVFSLANRGTEEARVFVRHAVPEGWVLRPGKTEVERLGGAYLFPVRVAPRSAVEVSIEEAQPVARTLDLRTRYGADSVGLYLQGTHGLPDELRKDLDAVLSLYREMADVEQRISTLGEQMNEYRQRIDELNVQLVTLRRVRTAQELSRHLARKMQEMSERLQTATIKSADLQEDLMTRRIRVQDRIADLSLRPAVATKVAGL